ncbi:MAG: cisplatin damage response ATP-dependent DNA ligase [Nisaea sp.]|uniref:cisplatin damage response ATP-dependent DNA ligase n=1 Tax=Nisaea sp. TaxID=2024842 RepID=UPI001B25C31A|nr:cisplatin damage response ATP-dependent DNA ligase [Nisaea sp.]MBO6561233.1 cisplatin damage response ATP-dependent DNA ligase [Nisaea sp.]
MLRFAHLLDRLLYAPQRNTKLKLMADYFRSAPDPDRGIALAALAGALEVKSAKPSMIRALVMQRVDPELFGWSYDFVGDLAETTALIWPERPTNRAAPALGEIPSELDGLSAAAASEVIESWLDTLDATGRWALLKLVTGGMRVGVSARLAKTALAEAFGREVDEIEEIWHGLEPPYGELFDWLEGQSDQPDMSQRAVFRPLMLANPLEEGDLARLDLSQYVAEWKWDGIRVQIASRGGEVRLYSRTGDDISAAFPDIVDLVSFEGVLDGELLVQRDGEVAPFNDLQQRLNRKRVTRRMLQDHPAHIRLYDILFDGDEDLRSLPFTERRGRLERFLEREQPERTDLSEIVNFEDLEALEALRDACRGEQLEGLMLKRRDSVYIAGRPKGPWFKWKRDALTLDTVVMYAQRGHGKRSSFYSDFTFGAWREGEGGPELVPVGKAYSGFTDEELKRLDKWVRDNTVQRYGPVREVAHGLVVEVAFDSVHRSSRHKSGVAMRFPRFHRIRWDKPVEEADRLESLEKLIV